MKDKTARSSFNDWVNAYTGELLRWAIYKTGDHELSQDIVQDTFVAAWQGLDGFQNQSTPRTWLFSILRRKIADWFRSRDRDALGKESISEEEAETLFQNHFDAEGRWSSADFENNEVEEMEEKLQLCLEKLPDNWRDVLESKYIQCMKADEICQVFGLSPTNYWQIIHRTKVLMRSCLGTREQV